MFKLKRKQEQRKSYQFLLGINRTKLAKIIKEKMNNKSKEDSIIERKKGIMKAIKNNQKVSFFRKKMKELKIQQK